MSENTLYYGGNLDILRRYVRDESVDLVYLGRPFQSDQNYNGFGSTLIDDRLAESDGI